MITPWKKRFLEKVIDPFVLQEKGEELREKGLTIATLNGSFDLLHAGHLHIIYEASRQADILIVALNTDASIKKYKSPQRPFVSLEDRLQMVAALECVDYVTWFDETTPNRFIKTIKPHVHVNGAEYGADPVEGEAVKKVGARLHLVDRVEGLSTTELVKKIQEQPAAHPCA